MANTPVIQNGGGPWWVKPLYMYGVPSVIAMFLVYEMTIGVAQDLREHARASEDGIEHLIRVFTVSCVNAAGNDVERRYCVSPELLQLGRFR